MTDYSQFPELQGVYLEDTFVLATTQTDGRFTFHVDAVLTPSHPAYRTPRPGEHHCYVAGRLVFPNATHVEWVRRSLTHFTDASGETDLGNIDILHFDGGAFVLEGDWGKVRIIGARPRFELDS